jgi:hypothetical protein
MHIGATTDTRGMLGKADARTNGSLGITTALVATKEAAGI